MKLKQKLMVAIVAATTAVPAMATTAPGSAFSNADVASLFDQSTQPLQLAALSGQEMKETEGAWAWHTAIWTVGGGVVGSVTYLTSTPRSRWSWGNLGRSIGAGATSGFYNSNIPMRALGRWGSYTFSALGGASWFRW